MKILNVRSKNSAASAHFIQGPRPTLRRKKRPRMNKERVQVAKRHRLSLANRNRKKEEQHTFKDSFPGYPKQKGLTLWASHGSMVEEQFQEKLSPPH